MGRFLAHPRFRAAFDFLVLRQSASPEHAEDIAFWREAQVDAPEAEEGALEFEADTEGAPRRRRRRRRRPSGATTPE